MKFPTFGTTLLMSTTGHTKQHLLSMTKDQVSKIHYLRCTLWWFKFLMGEEDFLKCWNMLEIVFIDIYTIQYEYYK